ncbi:hypothetical protein EYV94_17955 [Puteibacter caeruleilacunae]|nr:hypothetical protein EYV94_17955 [Puteibacter caeruleilacunae]
MNKENLEGIVSKLKQQGIQAGEEEKQRIIESAKQQAKELLADAEAQKNQIIEEAKTKAEQTEKNAEMAIAQASRDMVEATKVSVLNYMKSVFGVQCDNLFRQEQYLQELLKVVVETISGNKTVKVPAELESAMNAYLLKQGLSEQIELKPLADNSAKIEVNSAENKGVQFVLSSEDVKDGLFALLNKDLVERITKTEEA